MEEEAGVKRKIEKKRYVLSFIIGTAVFLLVFFISYSISYSQLQKVSNEQLTLAYEIFQNKLDYSFFNKSICTNESFKEISEDLAFQGRIMGYLEEKFGKSNQQVLSRKEFYSIIELEHLEFVNLKMKNCNFHINTVLFFYSNLNQDLTRSESVGRILDTIRAQYPNNVMIYSFDINLDSDLISNLLDKYNIVASPTVIVNENYSVYNPQVISDIEKYLV